MGTAHLPAASPAACQRGSPPTCTAPHMQVAAMSSQLIWELVKKGNAFLRKSVNGTTFSAEPGNL